MKIALVILTLNEIDGLKIVLNQIPRTCVDEIFAVDGGSSDGSIEFMQENGIRVIVQERRGRGEAFRVAFSSADSDAIIFFSPDGNEEPKDIPKFRIYLEQGFDLVIANRMNEGGSNEEDMHLVKIRKWANNLFTWMANATWNRGKYIYDSINGFRAITHSAWNTLMPDGENYTIEYQTTIRAFKKNLKIAEFPTHEHQRIGVKPGSPGIKTGLAFLKLYFKEWNVR